MADQQPARSKRRRINPKPKSEDDTSTSSSAEPSIDIDDTCPICHLLIYRPVTTRCSHTLCEFCMSTWADISVTSAMTILGLDVNEPITIPTPSEVEMKCPMCRTQTGASFNADREQTLKTLYPRTYAAREAEANSSSLDENSDAVEILTLYIGNEHKLIRTEADSSDSGAQNKHEWKFFVRPSRNSLIEEIQLFLHPTFRNAKIVISHPPYEIIRLGWGTFTMYANVILKAGYSWVHSDAEDTEDGGRMGKLGLEWNLDFNGRGSQGRLRLKVKKEKDTREADERDSERVRRAWARQRRRDPDYEPPPTTPPQV